MITRPECDRDGVGVPMIMDPRSESICYEESGQVCSGKVYEFTTPH